jgi:hypothetical protein
MRTGFLGRSLWNRRRVRFTQNPFLQGSQAFFRQVIVLLPFTFYRHLRFEVGVF